MLKSGPMYTTEYFRRFMYTSSAINIYMRSSPWLMTSASIIRSKRKSEETTSDSSLPSFPGQGFQKRKKLIS
ncbi:hypothetical protein PR048_014085 [Dryococelus australis]|uniref:Uncharacterized protein n=1 Tax=Dryococelus australis TaxID=614101 RepID=A0ABQ9HTZ0_9NEOP|nr:hypothetical protein PR048_014085 [Dryococelus australis]